MIFTLTVQRVLVHTTEIHEYHHMRYDTDMVFVCDTLIVISDTVGINSTSCGLSNHCKTATLDKTGH